MQGAKMTRANSKSIQRWGRGCVCLLLAVGCAPDQFVSMGFDVGGAPSQLGQSSGGAPASSPLPSNAGAYAQGCVAAGGDQSGSAGKDSGSAAGTAGFGGTTVNFSPSATGGAIGAVIRLL
jgi:hypothetical protein